MLLRPLLLLLAHDVGQDAGPMAQRKAYVALTGHDLHSTPQHKRSAAACCCYSTCFGLPSLTRRQPQAEV